jgi:NAD(P)-dependent dehydrogenase (short-subunit alcohol dehydrogenase family)
VSGDQPSFGALSTTDEVLDGVDLAGRVAVITGASSGLGRELARALLSHGATVVAAVRDPASAPAGSRGTRLDLTSLDSVRTAAAELRVAVPTIDLLFLNAGVMATPEARTSEGFELQLGTNHLGHFLLTALVADTLAADARIVLTSSLGHALGGMLWDDPHFRTTPYNKWQAYAQSKSANILFALGLADRGRSAYAVHPGAVGTELTRHLEGDELAFVRASSQSEAKTVEQGAATIALAAIADGLTSGAYLADCAVAEASPHATDPAEVDRLWSWSEEQVGQPFAG